MATMRPRFWNVGTGPKRYADRLAGGRRAYVYLESPCNPHGYVLDVPGICREAHARGMRVMLDATVGTPFLIRPLQREDPVERPDFVIHSYTKDLSGTGSVIAGVVIGRNHDMFLPKGEQADGISWDQTLFWNVYYVKGAFLNADAAFEVLQGLRTLDVRMLAKCINTLILARFFNAHPQIEANCNALPKDDNYAPSRTVDVSGARPAAVHGRHAGHPASGFSAVLRQSGADVRSHDQPGAEQYDRQLPGVDDAFRIEARTIRRGRDFATTIRFAVGDEDPKDLIAHFIAAARLATIWSCLGSRTISRRPADR